MNPERDWTRVKSLGVLPGVKSPIAYQERVVEGLGVAEDYVRRFANKVPTVKDIQTAHFLAFREVHPWAGDFRPAGYEVQFGNMFGTLSTEVPKDLQRLSRDTKEVMATADGQAKQIFWAAFYHAAFEKIHPFQDGNGRIGRVILGAQLDSVLQDKKRTILEREEYLSALKEAQQTMDPTGLATLVARERYKEKELERVKKRLREQSLQL